MLKADARDLYYDKINGRGFSFENMTDMTRQHFETAERHQQLLSNWYSILLPSLKRENPDKSTAECFELMLNQLRKLQRGLGHEYRSQTTLWDRLINACRDTEECQFAVYKPSATFGGVAADIRSAIATASRSFHNVTSTVINNKNFENSFFTDRCYHTTNQNLNQYDTRNSNRQPKPKNKQNRQNKCLVCEKFGCCSTRYPHNEREAARSSFRQRLQRYNKPYSKRSIQQYVLEFEGVPDELYMGSVLDEYDSLKMN